MHESDRKHAIDRRTFLRRLTIGAAAASAAIVGGEAAFDALARLAPRPALVPVPWGISSAPYPEWSSYVTPGLESRFSYAMFERNVAMILGRQWVRADTLVVSEKMAEALVDRYSRNGDLWLRA